MNLNRLQMLSALAIIILSLTIHASAEWNEQVLYSFQGGSDGQTPAGGVVFDKQGNLYGTTETGTVFQLAPPAKKGDPWTETVLYLFLGKSNNNDGLQPSGGLVIDSSGNLYGTTAYGGTGGCILLGILYGCGTVYELSPPQQKGGQWTETILYSFQSGNDGYYPWGNLTFDKAGNLYGATQFGGGKGNTCDVYYGGNCGTVFKLSPPKQKGGAWTENVLQAFAGVAQGKQFGDGANPNGGLVSDRSGNLYGTTYFGGNNVKGKCQGGVGGTGCGIAFELLRPVTKGGTWTKRVIHEFNGQDGSNSAAGVIVDKAGNLYGTTVFGSGPYGLVFELKRPPGGSHFWTEVVLHSFTDGNDGANPMAGLALDSQGNLYGTAYRGQGTSQYGDVVRLTAPSWNPGPWTLTVLYGFHMLTDGGQPASALSIDAAENLYGTTQYGGTGQSCQGGCGTVFKVSQ